VIKIEVGTLFSFYWTVVIRHLDSPWTKAKPIVTE
jgi:hypothetical protein